MIPSESSTKIIHLGSEFVIILEGGEEWSLVEDLTTRARPATWVDIDRASCRPANEVLADLERLP